jgi:hypothetical protein
MRKMEAADWPLLSDQELLERRFWNAAFPLWVCGLKGPHSNRSSGSYTTNCRSVDLFFIRHVTSGTNGLCRSAYQPFSFPFSSFMTGYEH